MLETVDQILQSQLELGAGGVSERIVAWNLPGLMLGDLTEDEDSDWTDEEEDFHLDESEEEEEDVDQNQDDLYLWIGQVDNTLEQEDLWDALSAKMGTLRSLDLIRPRNCALATFECNADAIQSLKHEGALVGSQHITLHVGKTASELFVSNLEDVSPHSLRKAFQRFGTVKSVRVMTTEKCGFVAFASSDDASCAMRNLNGQELGQNRISVRMVSSEQEYDEMVSEPFNVSDLEKRYHSAPVFNQNKELTYVVKDVHNTSHRRAREQWSNLEENHGTTSNETVIVPNCWLYVSNLHPSLSEQRLTSVFSRFGELQEVVPHINEGFAFVCFKNVNDAHCTLKQMRLLPPVLLGKQTKIRFGRPVYESTLSVPSAYAYSVKTVARSCPEYSQLNVSPEKVREIQVSLN